MQHQPIERDMTSAAPPSAITAPVQETLSDIVTGLDARFMHAGEILETTILTIDRVVQSLNSVGQAFDGGDAGMAVDTLSTVAHRLKTVPEQQAQRSAELAAVRAISQALSQHVAEVATALEVLKIYGLNVKIASSGAEDFVDFAIRMQRQLEAGEDQIAGLGKKLSELNASLGEMETNDRWLLRECAKVVPQVPDRLASDAAGLREQQVRLCALATEVRGIAQAIQGNVAAVLSAIQIGDITRQRLEHVLYGCQLLDTHLSTRDEGPEDDGTRHHLLRLLSAQLFDTADDFSEQTSRLITSLRDMGPQAAQLVSFSKGKDSLSESRVFLRRVEAGIAQADAVTLQLRNADRQVESVVTLIIDTVQDLEDRARKVSDLRIDVQQMAINIGLRCRHSEKIGRPVIVIANEIRSYADKLDSSTSGIIDAAGKLGSVSLAMQDQGEKQGFQSEDALARSVTAIGEGAQLTEKAMAIAGTEANEIVAMLQDIGNELGSSLALQQMIITLGETLAALAGPETPLDEVAQDHPARLLMEQLGRSYTMAQEREIHDQFLLPGMAAIFSAAASGTVDLDDDDLFDDALF